MSTKPYDASRKSLFQAGEADDFFQLDSLEKYLQNDAALCAEMTRLAYAKEETRLDQYLNRAGFQKDIAIGYSNKGTQVFIASKGDVTIVSFRGTEVDDPTDLFIDANLVLTNWKDSAGKSAGKVHDGFADALLDNGILDAVMKCVNLKTSPNHILLITGHSMGAALATLTANLLPSSILYTFGSPRVGDKAFVDSMLKVNHTRFVDCCDIVTQVPPEIFDYHHTGLLRYINRHGQILNSPGEDEISSDRHKASVDYFLHQSFLHGTVFTRDLADHTPINYVSGVMGLRVEV
jgi:hypothetical protein